MESPTQTKKEEIKESTPSTASSVKVPPKELEISPDPEPTKISDPHMPLGCINQTEEREKIDYNGETKVIVRKRYELADGSIKEVKYLEDG